MRAKQNISIRSKRHRKRAIRAWPYARRLAYLGAPTLRPDGTVRPVVDIVTELSAMTHVLPADYSMLAALKSLFGR